MRYAWRIYRKVQPYLERVDIFCTEKLGINPAQRGIEQMQDRTGMKKLEYRVGQHVRRG